MDETFFMQEMAGSGDVRTIEDFAQEIVGYLDRREMKKVNEMYEKLQKMKSSSKEKHEQNYWKVLQCLGEVGIESFILVIKTNSLHSCHCHIYTNLYDAINMFAECLINVNIVKRVVYHRHSLVPVFFVALHQQKEERLVFKALVIMYRCVLVGKGPIVELYMQNKILRDLSNIMKAKQEDLSTLAINYVEYVTKITHGLAMNGDRSARLAIKRSQVLSGIEEYRNQIVEKKAYANHHMSVVFIVETFKELKKELEYGGRVPDQLSVRLRLRNDVMMTERGYFIFCSSPNCRKQFVESENFRYCGACRLARYCCKDCQKDHWKNGHKEKCLKLACLEDS